MLTKQQIQEDLKNCINSRSNNLLIVVVGVLIGILVEIFAIRQPLSWHISKTLALSTLITFLCWHGNALINSWHLAYMPWNKNPPRKVLYLFLLNSTYTSLVISLAILGFHYIIHLIPAVKLVATIKAGVGIGMIVSFFTNTIFVSIYFFGEWKASLIEAERLKSENVQSQLNSLRSQVNPHFLFNSLNTLTSLIAEDQDKAINFVRDFSDLYRYILKSQEKEVSTLEEELYATNAYLKLQKERFEEKLKVEIDVAEEYLHKYLPTLTLQMLVENCIKHNVISQSKPLKIQIYIKEERLFVVNNLQKKQTELISTGLGLKNIVKRYDFLHDEDIEIIQGGGTFEVVLPLLTIHQK